MDCYVGVEFQNNDGIAIVHSAWLTPLKREVFWPPKQTTGNFVKLLKTGQEPPQDNTWKLYKIKRIFFETDDYKTAEKKIKKAEVTSDLTSDANEFEISPRRKRRPRKFSTDDEQEQQLSSSEDDFPKNKKPLARPKPIVRKSNSNVSIDYSGPTRALPLVPAVVESQQSFEDSASSQLHYLQPQYSLSDSRLIQDIGKNHEGFMTNNILSKNNLSNTSQQSSLFIDKIPLTRPNQSQYFPSTNNEAAAQSRIRNLPMTVTSAIGENNRDNQNDVVTLLKTIKEQNNQILEWIRKQDRVGNHISNTSLPDDIGVQFPLNSEEDITKLDTYLNEKNNSLALSAYLSTFGGRDFIAHTNRILKFLFTYSLASKWNFCGKRGGKSAFKNLNVKDVIIGAVRKSSPSTSQKEIEDTIKVWLKHAPEKMKKQNGNP